MSKHIIIDWQRSGLFVAMGTRRGNTVSIDTLVTTGGGEGGNGSSTAISTQLFALAKQLDLNKAEATLIAPREILEFRTLTVPRAEPDEIPDMVRFQAQRQMANIGDTWPLDYMLLPDKPGQDGISALAATISPAHMAELEATCSDLGIQLTRVLPRPIEIARWGVAAGGLASTEVSVIIALSSTHADILIVSRGTLIQIRSTRLPEDSSAMPNVLVAEIRRSMLAAASDLNSQSINKVLLIAAPELAERVESVIAQATSASVAMVDPASTLPASLPERHELALLSANRLAAIAGVLYTPAPEKSEVIDLKNCKRREPKKSRSREYTYAGIGVGVLALLGYFWWWSAHASLDLAIKSSRDLEKQKKQETEDAKKLIKQGDDVNKFLAGSINWLDELTYLSEHLPPSEELMLYNPSFELLPDNTGVITVGVDAKNATAISDMEVALKDSSHTVTGSGSKELEKKRGMYGWSAKEVIRVQTKGWDPFTKPNTKAVASTNAAPKPTDEKSKDVPKASVTPVANPTPNDGGTKSEPSTDGAKLVKPTAEDAPKASATDKPAQSIPPDSKPTAAPAAQTQPAQTQPAQTQPAQTQPPVGNQPTLPPNGTAPASPPTNAPVPAK